MPQSERPPPARTGGGLGRFVAAMAAGFAGGLLAPLVYPSVARGARPAAKKVLKAGMAAVERGRIAAAELSEHASDLMAEVHAEHEEDRQRSMQPRGSAQSAQMVDLRPAAREAAAGGQ